MRPGQNNKRMRGRPNNNRKGPNPLTRSYESSGPDVKIRGTAHHIGEKYLQLARDAQTSGDPVMAESYLQHAEHYFRLIAAAQQAPQQGTGAYQGQQGEANVEEAEDSDFGGMPDRFASPAERFAPPQPSLMPQPQPSPAQPGRERSFHNSEDRQGFTRPERAPRPERPFQDAIYRDRDSPASAEKSYQQQRPYQERNGRGRDQENRGNRGRGPRDYRNEGSILVDPRAESQMAEAGIEDSGLPAFITAPVRVPADALDAAPPVETLSPLFAGPPEVDDAASGFHPRPRRRGGKADTGVAGPPRSEELKANDSIQD